MFEDAFKSNFGQWLSYMKFFSDATKKKSMVGLFI
jgi:hypothetical protein